VHKITNAILGASVQFQMGRAKKNSHAQKDLMKNLKAFKFNRDNFIFNQIFEELNTSKLGEGYINGNFFPPTISEISRWSEIEFGTQFDLELRWNMKIFYEYREAINDFVKTKNNVETLILQERYQEALDILSNFEEKYGVSLWLLENKIYLYSKLERDSEDEILSECQYDSAVKSVLLFYKLKNDPNLGSRDYDYIVKRELQEFLRKCPEEKDTEEYFQYMIGAFSFEYSDTKIFTLLKNTYKMPLVDRYIVFIDICTYIISSNSKYISVLKEHASNMVEIEDRVLQSVYFVISDKKSNNIKDDLLPIKDTLVEGNFPACQEMLEIYIQKNPSNVEAICLYAKINASMQIEETNFNNTLNTIINSLSAIFTMKKDYNDNVENIYKILVIHSKATWAKAINYEIMKKCNPFSGDIYTASEKASSIQGITWETVFTFKDVEWIKRGLVCDNKYIRFRLALKEGDYSTAEQLCECQDLRNIVVTLEKCNNNDFDEFPLIKNPQIESSFQLTNINILWNRLNITSNADFGITLFVNCFIKNRLVALFMPMGKYIEYCDNLQEEKPNLTTIIFYYIYISYFDISRKDDLVFLLEIFFNEKNISKPSKMDIYSSDYDRAQLIFFLKNVCVQTILGPILINMKTTKELDDERLEICQILRSLDGTEEKAYEQEIKDITHKLFINEGVQTLQNSKIEVNTEGIKSRLLADTKEDFQRLMLYRSLQMDKILEYLGKYQNTLRVINFDSNQLFKDIIITIRDAFVSGDEYGLEGNLSMNIRHGTLSEQLRRPLLNANLFAVYNNKEGLYVLDDKLKYPANMKNAITNIIGTLNEDTEDIINYLKKQLIQVKTEKKHTNGVFDYSMNEDNFAHLLFYLKEDMEFEDYLDIVFTYLWELTERNLDNIKARIKGEISEKYNNAFDKARKQLAMIDKGKKCTDIAKKINESEIELQNELNIICSWFKRSASSQYQDFNLDSAFQIALKMIQNVHPNKKFKATCIEEDFDRKIKGGFLKNYCNIFYTLFDNVNAYAMPSRGIIEIRYKLKVQNNTIEIYMENDYDCSQNYEEQQLKMEHAKSLIKDKKYLSKAKTEGGSGIPKICKILNVDLYKDPQIDLGVDDNKKIFYITVKGVPIGTV
jgi:hypothetical protein